MAMYDKKARENSDKTGPVVEILNEATILKRKADMQTMIEITRAKFTLASHFVNDIAALLRIAFRNSKTKTSTRGLALSQVLRHAVTGDYPDIRIDYSKVLVASGCLSRTVNPAATSREPGIIKFTWKDSTGHGNAKAIDKPILIAYCEKLNACRFIVSDAGRFAETASLPAQVFRGQQVHTWISFLSASGKNVARSSYTGALTVM